MRCLRSIGIAMFGKKSVEGVDNVAMEIKIPAQDAVSNGTAKAAVVRADELRINESQTGLAGGDHPPVMHPTSYLETLTHLLRGNIGSGMFAMGDAFRNAGIIVAPIVTLLLGVVCVHSQHMLLSASREMGARTKAESLPHFAETVQLCFQTGPPRLRRMANSAWVWVNVFLCITQIGFCCVYFVFIASNIKLVMDAVAPNTQLDLHLHMFIIFLPILLSCWIRNLKFLVPLSSLANFLMAAGIVATLYVATQDLPPVHEREYVASWKTMPLFFGTAIYAFEGIGLVLPLQEQMREPKQFAAPFGVLNVGMVLVSGLFVSMGFVGYLKYGMDVKGSITLNLPPGDILSQCVQMAIALAILFTYALQMYVPARIMWPGIVNRFGPFQHPVFWETVFRSLLVLLTFVLAEGIPKLGLFISLVGAVSSCALALLFPSVIDVIVRWDTTGLGRWNWILWKNVLIFVIGVVGFATGTYASVDSIVKELF